MAMTKNLIRPAREARGKAKSFPDSVRQKFSSGGIWVGGDDEIMREAEAAAERQEGVRRKAVEEWAHDLATDLVAAGEAEYGDQPDALDEAAALLAQSLGWAPDNTTPRRILELTVAEAVRRMRAELFADEGDSGG